MEHTTDFASLERAISFGNGHTRQSTRHIPVSGHTPSAHLNHIIGRAQDTGAHTVHNTPTLSTRVLLRHTGGVWALAVQPALVSLSGSPLSGANLGWISSPDDWRGVRSCSAASSVSEHRSPPRRTSQCQSGICLQPIRRQKITFKQYHIWVLVTANSQARNQYSTHSDRRHSHETSGKAPWKGVVYLRC